MKALLTIGFACALLLALARCSGGDPNQTMTCSSDPECPIGQVCESCSVGDAGTCVLGCHAPWQCGIGQQCRMVDCFSCPCPGQCE